jgi:hypothetical protein
MGEPITQGNIEQRISDFRTWGQTQLKNSTAKELVNAACTVLTDAYAVERQQFGGSNPNTQGPESNPRMSR